MKLNNIFNSIIMLALFAALCICVRSCNEPKLTERTVTLAPGDSYWTLAKSYCPDGMERCEYIHRLRLINGIEPEKLQAGKTVKILEAE